MGSFETTLQAGSYAQGEMVSARLLADGRFAELVALGFILRMDDVASPRSVVHWVELLNVSDQADRRFEISGAQVREILSTEGRRPDIIWHSHSVLNGPSETDIEFFPAHLVEYGAVFHVPSGETVLYNGDGVISSASSSPQTPSATTDNTDS